MEQHAAPNVPLPHTAGTSPQPYPAAPEFTWLMQVMAIIVSPTRELAKQIHSVAQPFVASVPGLSSMLLVGGT